MFYPFGTSNINLSGSRGGSYHEEEPEPCCIICGGLPVSRTPRIAYQRADWRKDVRVNGINVPNVPKRLVVPSAEVEELEFTDRESRWMDAYRVSMFSK